MSRPPKRRWDDAGVGRGLKIFQATLSAIAVIALIIAIIGLVRATASRRESARDSCQLLRGLVVAATTGAPKQRVAAQAYVNRTPLRDCNAYAHSIVR